MKKGLNQQDAAQRPKQQRSLFDNYKPLLAAMAFLLLSFCAAAQKYSDPTLYGKAERRTRSDSTMLMPTGCGVPWALSAVDISQKRAAQYYDSCNKRYYMYDPKLNAWDSIHIGISGAGGGSPLDTTGQFLKSVYRVSGYDSLYFNIGSDIIRIKDSVGKPVTSVLSLVTDIASINDAGLTELVVKDTIRGGTFLKYSGTDAADGGMIFTDALAQKWKRVLVDDKIRPTWYGAHQTASAATNDAAFSAAMSYGLAHKMSITTLFIPGGAGWYYKNTTIFFVYPQYLNIEGEGSTESTGEGTKISWPTNTQGIVYHTNGPVGKVSVKNIRVRNVAVIPRVPTDTTKALVETRLIPFPFENIAIEYATNIGFKFEGCIGGDSTSNPITGATDYGVVRDCGVIFAIHGAYINGCDANYMSFYDFEAGQCTRWGVYDNSLLGCNFYSTRTQANSNASIDGAATTVTYGGNYYAATFLHDDGSGIGKRPDLQPTYWTLVGVQAATAWDTTKHYWTGGSRASVHPSGTSQWYSPYDEGDQASPQLNTRSMQFGGVRGAGIPGGTIYRDQATFNFTDVSSFHKDVAIGNKISYPVYPLDVASNVFGTLARFRTTAIGAIIQIESDSGATSSYLWAQSGIAYWGVNGVRLALHSGAFYDSNNDGVVDLGAVASRWKNAYAVNYFGSGANLTGVIKPADTTAKWVTDIIRVPGVDSFWFKKGSTFYGIKDSVGEINTASNLGGGLANYSTKVGVDLQFNSFNATDFDLASNLISIDAGLKADWNTAYTDRLKWDGGATGLTAATGRTSLGGTTIGQNMFTSTNPSAITFGRANADNTFDWLSASSFRTAIGAGTGSGDLLAANNLSDVSNVVTSRNNILPSKTGNALKLLRVNAGETDYELAAATGGGDVSKVGTPVNNQIGIWTGDGTIKGTADFTNDGTTFISADFAKFTGGFSTTSFQAHTSGATVTISNTITTLNVNPASVLAALTITMPASPTDGQWVYLSFGGTVTAGAAVVTSLTVSPNAGQSLYQSITPTASNGADEIIYQYDLTSTTWKRKK